MERYWLYGGEGGERAARVVVGAHAHRLDNAIRPVEAHGNDPAGRPLSHGKRRIRKATPSFHVKAKKASPRVATSPVP